MDNGEKHLEDNIKRLIQVGFGLSPRPDPRMKEQTWQQLVRQLDTKQRCISFPDGTLVILACALAWMAVWIMRRMLGIGLVATVMLPIELVHIVLVLNLFCVPVSGIVVVMARRRYVE